MSLELSEVRATSEGPPPCPAASAVTIRELVPPGWEAETPSDGARFANDEEGNEVIVWDLEGESLSPRTLTYTLVAPGEGSGEVTLRGEIEDNTSGGSEALAAVSGDSALTNSIPLGEVDEFGGPGGFIRHWLLLGPFENPGGRAPGLELMRYDYLTDGEITESTVRPVAGDRIESRTPLVENSSAANPEGVPTWMAWRDLDDVVDPQPFYGGVVTYMFYAVTYFSLEEERELELEVAGPRDAVRVLLDGLEVETDPLLVTGEDVCGRNARMAVLPLGTVQPGVHTLMIKIFKGPFTWSCFRARLLDATSFEPLTDYDVCLEPTCGAPPEEGPRFVRGDCTGEGRVDITDAVCILEALFAGGDAPCRAALNTSGDGAANITDATYLLNFLFAGGPGPVPPYPECGTSDLAADATLGCETGCR